MKEEEVEKTCIWCLLPTMVDTELKTYKSVNVQIPSFGSIFTSMLKEVKGRENREWGED